MVLRLPPLYGILDPEQTQGRATDIVLREMLEAGVTILQLRVKSLAPVDFLELAKLARAATRAHNCTLIVNDRIDVTLACDADGVHLGQEDLPLSAGRKLMGPRIVGISTHNLQQAQEAERNGADYVGFGPMFGTTTKLTGYAARGIEMLKQIHSAIRLPVVAIGGITEENVQQVWHAGADSAAIISDILHADDIRSKVSRILRQQQASQQD
ncbi:MAG: thiamine-phosphate pyrophosphorylase [Candidatus Binatota bacterium]|nr:thiamine-phosphate pyrophosphorylase [Candidatus Binatota bacterium]